MLPSPFIESVPQKGSATLVPSGRPGPGSKKTDHHFLQTGSKFTSKWDGSYVVREVYTNGVYKIVGADGLHVGPINGKFLKRYYP